MFKALITDTLSVLLLDSLAFLTAALSSFFVEVMAHHVISQHNAGMLQESQMSAEPLQVYLSRT